MSFNRLSKGKVAVAGVKTGTAGVEVPADGTIKHGDGFAVMMQEVLFTETAGAGTYTGSIVLPAGNRIIDIGLDGIALWNASGTVTAEVGDEDDPDGFFTSTNLKATDLLAGEINNLEHPGGKAGAYIASEQRVLYSTTERTVTCVITAAGTGGSTGRTRLYVVYCVPTVVAATKA